MTVLSTRRAVLSLVGLLCAAFVLSATSGSAKSRGPKHVLVVSFTGGYHHSSIEMSQPILKRLGEESHLFDTEFANTAEEVQQKITADHLKDLDLVIFDSTTGELPISDANKTAFMDWLKAGHGFVGRHAATDTLYQWADYGSMIGGYFNGHPWHQLVTLHVEDPKFPGTTAFNKPAVFPEWGTPSNTVSFKPDQITDEIYQFRNWSRGDKHVLLTIDNASIDTTKGARDDKDYAVAWAKRVGKGRVFYTSLGHREDVWNDPRYQAHIMGGIKWALGLSRYKVHPDQPEASTPASATK